MSASPTIDDDAVSYADPRLSDMQGMNISTLYVHPFAVDELGASQGLWCPVPGIVFCLPRGA